MALDDPPRSSASKKLVQATKQAIAQAKRTPGGGGPVSGGYIAGRDQRPGRGYSPWNATAPWENRNWGSMLNGTVPPAGSLGGGVRGKIGGGTSLIEPAAIEGGGGGGGGSLSLLSAPAEPIADPLSDPAYLALLAQIDAEEAATIGGIRTRQDAARRALDDLLGEIADRQGRSEVRTKEAQEGRGLLRSGATERLLADVAEAAGAERARGESATADQIAELERAIAEAKLAADRRRADTRLQFGGIGGVL